jgi:hypothetical protein
MLEKKAWELRYIYDLVQVMHLMYFVLHNGLIKVKRHIIVDIY